jgi:hypothetical protein
MNVTTQTRPQFGVTERNVWNPTYYFRTDGEKGEVYDPQGFLIALTPEAWAAQFIAETINEGDIETDDDDGEDEYDEALVDALMLAATEVLAELATVSGPFKPLRQKARKLKDALDAITAMYEPQEAKK